MKSLRSRVTIARSSIEGRAGELDAVFKVFQAKAETCLTYKLSHKILPHKNW
ncbi:hypothetical protein [Microcoleus sp. F4-D5]|uniref:hypothetical protein n=1 Tax=Microcoleus sp. F4-D5 TaxID=2818760 RepID=UPI002FD26F38